MHARRGAGTVCSELATATHFIYRNDDKKGPLMMAAAKRVLEPSPEQHPLCLCTFSWMEGLHHAG